MSFRRVSVASLSIALCVALLATMVPASLFAAQNGGKVREYIVTLDVKDSGRTIRPSNRASKARLRQRAKASRLETKEVTRRNGVKVRYQYGNVITGFSARMTKAQARKLAKDPSVAAIRVARIYRAAGEMVPDGIKRVKAYQGGLQPDVQANVAIIDSGIGPADSNGNRGTLTSNELKVAGGWNCAGLPVQQEDESAEDYAAKLAAARERYGDVYGHGTHVAGTIGARRGNGVGAVGVAPGVNLFAVRVFNSFGVGTDATVLCGLDWVADTYSNPTPDIDVVNMSIEGPRANMLEYCNAVVPDPPDPNIEPDFMHEAICTLKNDFGVPVVAAAGNSSKDANLSSPGGYDQVITVGAITDTDGVGWEDGNNATCQGYTGEKDDTFASYSNHGIDVDIVAPGTCVWSTAYWDASGDTLVRLTGTSMAAPHVTGAIARYVDQKGGLSNGADVSKLRDLIRAAGRMDWDAKTDPTWFGVNDTVPPNRVLDVTALTAANHGVKTFVSQDSFKVAGTQNSRTARVDVQRSGGYEGQVNLSTAGLPGAVGSTSFDDASLNGLGKGNLGTKLTFNLNASGGDGTHDVDVIANGNGVSPHPRPIKLFIDRTGPTVSDLRPRVRGQRTGVTRKGATQVFLQWKASDALSGLRSAQLQRKTGSAAWKNAGAGSAWSARVWLKPGQNNKFRVRATDSVGNVKNSYVISGRLSIRDSENGAINQIGTWKTKKTKKAYRGSLLFATAGAATLRTKFDGKAVAIMAPVGRGRGTFRVRVDGGPWKTVSTKAGSGAQRRVVWTARLSSGKHKLVIQRVSGKPAIDGIILVR